MRNCLFLRARGWGIDRQVRTKLQIPRGMPGGGMVTGIIEPCIMAGIEKNPCYDSGHLAQFFLLQDDNSIQTTK